MDKKLPHVFANKLEKEFQNNEKVYYSNVGKENNNVIEKQEERKTMRSSDNLNINQKINNIFNSNRYVYKADVNITTKEGMLNKKIIGQNSLHLITIDNELIPISDILDIEFSN